MITNSAIKRVTYRIMDQNSAHSKISLWVNGALVVSPGGITLRNEELQE